MCVTFIRFSMIQKNSFIHFSKLYCLKAVMFYFCAAKVHILIAFAYGLANCILIGCLDLQFVLLHLRQWWWVGMGVIFIVSENYLRILIYNSELNKTDGGYLE